MGTEVSEAGVEPGLRVSRAISRESRSRPWGSSAVPAEDARAVRGEVAVEGAYVVVEELLDGGLGEGDGLDVVHVDLEAGAGLEVVFAVVVEDGVVDAVGDGRAALGVEGEHVGDEFEVGRGRAGEAPGNLCYPFDRALSTK